MCLLDRRRREGKVAWATCRTGQGKNWMKSLSDRNAEGNKHRTKGPDKRGRLRLPGMRPKRLAPSWKAPSRSECHTSPRCLGVRSGSPGRAGWVRRQQHDPCGSHLAREKAEHEAGGWAAGTRKQHKGTPFPLPSLSVELGPAWLLAIKHIPQGTPPRSPHREGEGSRTGNPQGLGKGS